MKGIILINNAIFSPVFKKIAVELIKRNVDITIVTDSDFSIRKFNLDDIGCKIFSFERFLRTSEFSKHSIERYNKWNVHADFDRDNYYKSISSEEYNFWGETSADLYAFFENVYSSEKFDFVFYENVSNGLEFTANEVAKNFGIQYLGLTASRLPGRTLFSSLDDKLADDLQKQIDILPLPEGDKLEEIKTYIDNIQFIQPDYMNNNGLSSVNFMSKIFKKRDFTFIIETIRHSLCGSSSLFQIGNPLIKSFNMNLREITRWFCVRKIRKLFCEDLTSQPFYLYPLHYHPESSTSILAKHYDEYNLIRNISFSLPHGKYLVVKDHLSATGYEGYDFYKKLAKLPNVKLANPNLNAKELIKKSQGVFTLTSTVGYEAVLMNKPVTIFGDVFYMNHPLVYQCTGYKDIKNALNKMTDNFGHDNSTYNIRFVNAYDSFCFPLMINYNIATNPDFVNNICEKILSSLSKGS